jgi:bifunctional DNase/RNase
MQKMLNAEIWTVVQTNDGNAILLRPCGMEIAVPIFIGQLEIQSILIGREGLNLPRPLTHDLFLNIFSSLNLNLEQVDVCELKDNTFHARLVISGGEFTAEKPLVVDSRPSDAFALAVRKNCPIFIASAIIEQAGIPLDFFIEIMEETDDPGLACQSIDRLFSAPGHRMPPAMEKHVKLLEQLNQAVADEEYERAAEIRDILNQITEKDEDAAP